MAKDSLKTNFNFTRSELDLLITTLNVLIRRATTGSIQAPLQGICDNWERELRDYRASPDLLRREYPSGFNGTLIERRYVTYSLVEYVSKDWPYRAEARLYPIPNDFNFGMWAEPNKGMRLSLMRHITKRLRQWRRYTPA